MMHSHLENLQPSKFLLQTHRVFSQSNKYEPCREFVQVKIEHFTKLQLEAEEDIDMVSKNDKGFYPVASWQSYD